MLKNKIIAIIGTGNMGEGLVSGLIGSKSSIQSPKILSARISERTSSGRLKPPTKFAPPPTILKRWKKRTL
jgi:pyrroline-5-carboxylate reductase